MNLTLPQFLHFTSFKRRKKYIYLKAYSLIFMYFVSNLFPSPKSPPQLQRATSKRKHTGKSCVFTRSNTKNSNHKG